MCRSGETYDHKQVITCVTLALFSDLQGLYPGTRSAPSLLLRMDALKRNAFSDETSMPSVTTSAGGGSMTLLQPLLEGPETLSRGTPMFDDASDGTCCFVTCWSVRVLSAQPCGRVDCTLYPFTRTKAHRNHTTTKCTG